MRIGISVVAIVLLSLAVFTACFRPGPPVREQPETDTDKMLAPEVSEQMEADARKQLAFASLIERLPKGTPRTPTKALSSEAKERWENLDQQLAAEQAGRAKVLKELHERTRKFFVESPGAGPMRRMETPEELLMDVWYGFSGAPVQHELPKQPGEPADFPVSPGEPLSRIDPNALFHLYHDNGMSYFLYPRGFGYVKDRAHVAGFKSHGFRSNPSYPTWRIENWPWRVQHIQLVGILSHEQPVVYLTDKLPSMEQVRQGKTRTLDYFEESALPALREGEDLFIASKGETVRVMGALRATKTCQQCHDAEVGDLLGAFSYTLRRAPTRNQDE
jgi:hypothetical protein